MVLRDKGLRPTKEGFGEGMLEAAKADKRVCGIGADITSSVSMNLFADHFPGRFFSVGIAEQNAVGVAAGLALSGKLPVFSTYAAFAAHRAADQIRVSVCYNNVPVVIGGAHAGISVGPDGATHQALEDIAVMQSLPNMHVYSPCDATQASILTKQVIMAAEGPAYIRFGRAAVADFTSVDQDIQLGKAQYLKRGTDLTIVATGHMVWESIKAADLLEAQGISTELINIHSIKPLDMDSIVESVKKTNKLVCVEEHQVLCGLGSTIASCLSGAYPVPIKLIAVNDSFGQSGAPSLLLKAYGIDDHSIFEKSLEFVRKYSRW